MNGNGFLEAPAAIGYDNVSDAGRVAAHEMGHNWGRLHSACGGAGDLDPSYPYPGGTIGVYGFDVGAGTVKTPSQPDIMGYCGTPWISDYNYTAVMDFRGTALGVERHAGARPSVLVWGRIVGGQAILEPAFRIVTRPTPRRGGTYSVSGYSEDGARLFEFPFEPALVADDPRGARHFALAIPLDEAAGARLSSLRLTGPGAQAVSSPRAAALRPTGPEAESVTLRSTGGGISLEWNAEAHPMVMVRDPDSGEVLSFARGGRALVRTGKRNLDLTVSDGVRSRPAKVRIGER